MRNETVEKSSPLRMRDLSRRTGVPASTVHHYLHEGLLPPPHKPSRNSAIYSEDHVRRLQLIRDLRGGRASLPLASIRRILELVDQGVEVPVAVALHRQVTQGLVESPDAMGRRLTRVELAREADLDPQQIDELLEAGIILAAPGMSPPFDGADLQIARLFRDFTSRVPATIDDLGEIAALLKKASELEIALRDRATATMDSPAAAALSGHMQEVVNTWHAYLFSRLRQQEIAVRGLGQRHPNPATEPRETPHDSK